MERYDAQDKFHAWYEHWHRYHWVAPLLANKRVADMACGEGYGSALLAEHAQQVNAIDLHQPSIALAQKKYHKHSNLTFQAADLLQSPLADNSMDGLVSFETLEHLTAHNALIKEFKRVLTASGVLVISTPDKAVYSGSGDHNEFHLKELSVEEFTSLMATNFKHVTFFGQQFQTSSVIAPQPPDLSHTTTQSIVVAQGSEYEPASCQVAPTYLIAVASDDAAAIEPFLATQPSNFTDAENSLFAHYEKQIRTLLATDERVVKLEQQLKQQMALISQLRARLGL